MHSAYLRNLARKILAKCDANKNVIHHPSIGLTKSFSISCHRSSCRYQHKQISYFQARRHSTSSLLSVLPEVSDALKLGKPVVALESTILAHGLPYPQNLELANEVSSIIRSKGAIPATIAVNEGLCRVGLTQEELEDLAISGVEHRADKCSTRDLPLVIAKQKALGLEKKQLLVATATNSKHWGATTVASTMKIAHMAGIDTFVTGGTGGVHRNGENSMDVSADLLELSRTPVIVVSAGVKSILDIRRTLEMLETMGVPAASFGSEDEARDFPAFFSPSSGIPSPARFDNAEQVATAYLASLELDLPNGMLVSVPNRDPAGKAVEAAIQETLAEAEEMGISGRDVTPFILKRVAERTKGDSLKSNTALVKQNASVGADISVEISKQRRSLGSSDGVDDDTTVNFNRTSSLSTYRENAETITPNKNYSKVVVMGGSVIDLVAKPEQGQDLIPATSNPGICHESDGGVARNIAEVLGRLGSKPLLYSAVGNDSRGTALRRRMANDCDISSDRQCINVVDKCNTATYLAVLGSDGDLHTAIADMSVLSQIPVPDKKTLSMADYLVVDANPPMDSLVLAVTRAMRVGTQVFFEPTSVPKAFVASQNIEFMKCLTYAFPNLDELFAMTGSDPDDLMENKSDEMSIQNAAKDVLNKMNDEACHLVISMGKEGVLLASKTTTKRTKFLKFPTSEITVNNCTGAGDTLAGSFINSLQKGFTREESIVVGMEDAKLSLKCADRAICPEISNLQFNPRR